MSNDELKHLISYVNTICCQMKKNKVVYEIHSTCIQINTYANIGMKVNNNDDF